MDDGPEAVQIRQVLKSNAIGGRRTQRTEVSTFWHLFDEERALTGCGFDIGYGRPRQPWSDTPDAERCRMCASRHPDS